MPTRLVSHVIVVSLVVFAATAGLASQVATPGDAPVANGGFFVSAVRGADGTAPAPTTSSLLGGAPVEGADGALPLDGDDAAALDRGHPAAVPSETEPLATPVPIDPDATPLPAPDGAQAGIAASGTGSVPVSPSTRVAAPPPSSSGLVWPVPGGSVSQFFHAGHLAVDIAAPYGSAVVATQGGVVTWAGWRNNGGGYVISIDHGNGIVTTYNHLGAVWVGVGQYVAAGHTIGPVGCTGLCTGPHVHFEVRTNGVIDNPMRYY